MSPKLQDEHEANLEVYMPCKIKPKSSATQVNFRKFSSPFKSNSLISCNIYLLTAILVACISASSASYNCHAIKKCHTNLAMLDNDYLNKTFEIRCDFHRRIDKSDIIWAFSIGSTERMAYDLDGLTLYPFKHKLVDVVDERRNTVYSSSILIVPLINQTYFTNYTITSISGNCHRTIRLQLIHHSSSLSSGTHESPIQQFSSFYTHNITSFSLLLFTWLSLFYFVVAM